MTVEGSEAPERAGLDPLDRRLLELWVALYRKTRAQFRANSDRYGLTSAQSDVLQELVEPRAQRELARRLEVDASAVSVVVGQLEARGLVERTTDERDRRVRLVSRTAAGRQILDDLMSGLVLDAFMINDLGPAAKLRLVDALGPLARDEALYHCDRLGTYLAQSAGE